MPLLTPALVAAATGPTDGKAYNFVSDREVIGLGLRTTKSGAKSWVFSYRTHSGISRRLTIGNVGDWPLKLARDEARRLRRLVDQGLDPMGERHDLRERHQLRTAPKKRASSLLGRQMQALQADLRELKFAVDVDRQEHRAGRDALTRQLGTSWAGSRVPSRRSSTA